MIYDQAPSGRILPAPTYLVDGAEHSAIWVSVNGGCEEHMQGRTHLMLLHPAGGLMPCDYRTAATSGPLEEER